MWYYESSLFILIIYNYFKNSILVIFCKYFVCHLNKYAYNRVLKKTKKLELKKIYNFQINYTNNIFFK